jgi:small-conductance mechanosensitive channel
MKGKEDIRPAMTRLAGIDIAAPPWVVVPVFLLALLLVAALTARLMRRLTTRWLTGSPTVPKGEGRFYAAHKVPNIGVPVAVAVLVGGVELVLPELALPERLGHWTQSALTLVLVFSCGTALARIAVAGVTEYATRHPSVTPALGVMRVAMRVVVAILAGLMALQSLGVPVAPLLTTLGVGSLAVALALQDTLANFFAGLYLLAERPVRLGDYIKIHDGEEGYVEAIGWRSSRLRTQKNNTVIVPNQKLSQAILTNFALPAPPVAMSIPVTVPYEVEPATVERHLQDELSLALAEIPDMHGADVAVRLTNFGESGLVFQCSFTVRDFDAQARVGHELRKRLFGRLRREGIEMPYPQRVVHVAPGAPLGPHERGGLEGTGAGPSALGILGSRPGPRR